ncbi:flavodoxin [Aphanothece hegewaldii CCALA 016]|uniref:Flavodoxin n=1 Tax=Aphanothece hegewaldii CCALA 016 TaxID=2107694 RepID=A0A2T1M3R8_9CHRO|nr:FAD-binding oxidoreductase [Aphanothece hegewaldii]PSF39462.1 flavodoxin [Aphanothece hegewaldii CCALA 016]
MLKLKIFNSKKPRETQELEFLSDSSQNNYLIGRSSQCNIILPSPEIEEIQGEILIQEQEYYFIPYAPIKYIQFNDETVAENEQYLLGTNDIIRLQEFIIIIDSISLEGKIKPQKNIIPSTTKPKQTSEKKSNRLEQLKNRLKQKTPPENIITSVSTLPYPVTSSVPLLSENKWTTGEIIVKCVGIIQETHDVKTFRLSAVPDIIFNYKPGQFVTINLEIDGKQIKRSYTISSTPSRFHVLEITVKNNPLGLVSQWLHNNIKIGSEIKINPPRGKFTCVDHNSKKLLFISAGSGITPMMSMSRWLYDTATDRDIIFFHSAKTSQDLIFAQELNLLATQNPRFKLAVTLTRETWNGLTGHIDEAMIQQIAPDYKERAIYVCGPHEFRKNTKTLLQQNSFEINNYFEESFGSPKKATVKSEACIVFSQSNKEIQCSSSEPILDIAELEGVNIASLCRSGNCGTCKVRKLEGEITYECDPDGLSGSDKTDGYILTCIAHPVGKIVLET